MENKMVLAIAALDAPEATRLVCVLALGLLSAVESDLITLDEAEWMLFSPRTARILQDKGLAPELCQLILDGCELEDVLSLIPQRFKANVQALAREFSRLLESDRGYEQQAIEKLRWNSLYEIR